MELDQNPDEARTNGIRVSSRYESETYRLFRFTNDCDYYEWERVFS